MNALKIQLPHNLIGAVASGLCLIHCLATPFLFVAQAGAIVRAESHPRWWGALDLIFLVISFFAVWQSSKNTSKPLIRWSLWISWSLLALIVLNEKLSFFHIPEFVIYFPSAALIFLHLYNKKYCRCKEDECCVHS